MTPMTTASPSSAPTSLKLVKTGRPGRWYETPAGVFASVTTILSVVGKPALMHWSARIEREMVIEAAANLWDDVPTTPKMSRPAYVLSLVERIGKQRAHQRELARAQDIGTQVHGLIEWNLKQALGVPAGKQPVLTHDKAREAFGKYERWSASAGLTPYMIERAVYSARYGYAGTVDVFGRLKIEADECEAVLDWKTGKAVYDEALLQNAAYVTAMIEMGLAQPGCWGAVVRLPKAETDPDPEIKVISPQERAEHFEAFLAVKQLWQWLEDRKAARPQPDTEPTHA